MADMTQYDPSAEMALELRLMCLQLQADKIAYRDQCRKSFLAFVRHMEPGFKQAWFQLKLIQILQDVGDGKRKRVVINLPPGASKSTHARLFLAWFMGNHPHLKNIVTSYSDEIAADDNRGVQEYIDSDLYRQIFPLHLSLRNQSEAVIAKHGGVLYSAGIMGGLTGKRATGGILVDDPTKNAQQAGSPAYQHQSEQEWKLSARSRTQENSWILIITTRWRTDDFVGKRIEDAENNPQADQFTIFKFPAVKDDATDFSDPRQLGEPLWPEGGYGKEWADATRATLTPEQWSGQMQQSPTILGGGILKTFNFKFWYYPGCEPAPVIMPNNEGEMVPCEQRPLPGYFRRTIQSWDMTFKKTTSGSFVAGGVWGAQAPELPAAAFLLNQYRERTDFDGACNMVRRASTDYAMCREIWFEDKANGPGIKDHLSSTIPGINLIAPKGDKIERAHTAAVFLNAGNIYIPHPSIYTWVRDYIAECGAFPKGKNDDQVDQTTQACQILFNQAKWKVY